ncbi:MAG: T9SS type A sorting domain-containing protein [bacterium]
MKTIIYCLMFVILLASNTMSQVQKTWTGSHGSSWGDANNWDPAGVPGAKDGVFIPGGSPLCHVPDGSIAVGSLTNQGMLQINQTSLSTGVVINAGIISVTSNFFITQNGDGSGYNPLTSGFINMGSVSGDNAIFAVSQSSNSCFFPLTNSGSINANTVFCNVSQIDNNESASVQGNTVYMNCYSPNGSDSPPENVEPGTCTFGINSSISGRESTGSGEDGGSVFINSANTVHNYGNINSGNSSEGCAGNVTINSSYILNSASIQAGSGALGTGFVKASAKVIDNEGSISSGDSPGRRANNSSANQNTLGNIIIVADSIIFRPNETGFMLADTLKLIGNHIMFSDFTDYATIYMEKEIDFNTSANGIVDLSGVHTQGGISGGVGFKSIIHSNNVIPPVEGLNFIFDLAPEIFPADAGIVDLIVTANPVYSNAGGSGILSVILKNHCLSDKAINYTITSQKGWLNASTGNTKSLSFFESDTLKIDFVIPENAEQGSADIIDITASIGGFSKSITTTITSTGIPSPPTGIDANSSSQMPTDFELFQNYPNPFNPTTTIKYSIPGVETGQLARQLTGAPSLQHVTLKIYDVLGREVRTLVNEMQSPGNYEVTFNASCFSSGVYFYRIEAYDFVDVKKMLLMK